jgi:hypothetical protein
MPDYQNSRIYKIIDLETNECYIGSTTIALSQRLAQHVSTYKSYLNGKSVYVTSFKIIEQGNYDIVLIELFPCNNKEELHARESHYCQSITCVNMIKNQGLINVLGGKKEYNKQYTFNHKEHKKQYDELYRKEHMDQSKQYYKANIDHITEKSKQYNVDNKEKIKKHNNTVLICQCGCSYNRSNKLRHERSNKHQEYVKNRLYYDIQRGLDLIKKLDNYFKNKIL